MRNVPAPLSISKTISALYVVAAAVPSKCTELRQGHPLSIFIITIDAIFIFVNITNYRWRI